jgi:hypothetical protein
VARLARFINRDIVVVGNKLEETEAVNILGASTDWTGSQSREPGRPGRRCRELARDLDNAPESTPGSSCWCLLVISKFFEALIMALWFWNPSVAQNSPGNLAGLLLMTQFLKFLFEKCPSEASPELFLFESLKLPGSEASSSTNHRLSIGSGSTDCVRDDFTFFLARLRAASWSCLSCK